MWTCQGFSLKWDLADSLVGLHLDPRFTHVAFTRISVTVEETVIFDLYGLYEATTRCTTAHKGVIDVVQTSYHYSGMSLSSSI